MVGKTWRVVRLDPWPVGRVALNAMIEASRAQNMERRANKKTRAFSVTRGMYPGGKYPRPAQKLIAELVGTGLTGPGRKTHTLLAAGFSDGRSTQSSRNMYRLREKQYFFIPMPLLWWGKQSASPCSAREKQTPAFEFLRIIKT